MRGGCLVERANTCSGVTCLPPPRFYLRELCEEGRDRSRGRPTHLYPAEELRYKLLKDARGGGEAGGNVPVELV